MSTSFNWADFFILGVLLVSALFGLMRGMFKELMALFTWVFAYIVAQSFWPALDTLLQPTMSDVPSIRGPLAWGILFICSVLIGSLIQRIVLELVRATGLSSSDRALGGVFGVMRGVVIIVLLLTFLPLAIDFSRDKWWQESQLIPVFSAVKNSVMLAINSLIQLVQGTKLG